MFVATLFSSAKTQKKGQRKCKEEDYVICKKMNGTGGHCVKGRKPDLQTSILYFLSYAETRLKNKKTLK